MNKVVKNIIIGVIVLVLIYGLYVAVDSFRLKKADMGTKPFLTIGNSVSDDGEIEKLDSVTTKSDVYMGLGYSITYNYKVMSYYEDDTLHAKTSDCVAEFRLFNKILIWSVSK